MKLLALYSEHRLHREQITEALWPELGGSAASNNLRRTLHSARRALDPGSGGGFRYLVSVAGQLVLSPGGEVWVDVEGFEEAAATARGTRDPSVYKAALDLYTGDLLPENRFEEWVQTHQTRLRETYLSLLLELARLYEEVGNSSSAVELYRKVIAETPLWRKRTWAWHVCTLVQGVTERSIGCVRKSGGNRLAQNSFLLVLLSAGSQNIVGTTCLLRVPASLVASGRYQK